MPAAKTPQDHKKKPAAFKFIVDGVSYTLPPVDEEVAQKVEGGIVMDAIMRPNDDNAQMALGFATLVAAVPAGSPALTALRSLPLQRMLEVFARWMGESSGSSD